MFSGIHAFKIAQDLFYKLTGLGLTEDEDESAHAHGEMVRRVHHAILTNEKLKHEAEQAHRAGHGGAAGGSAHFQSNLNELHHFKKLLDPTEEMKKHSHLFRDVKPFEHHDEPGKKVDAHEIARAAGEHARHMVSILKTHHPEAHKQFMGHAHEAAGRLAASKLLDPEDHMPHEIKDALEKHRNAPRAQKVKGVAASRTKVVPKGFLAPTKRWSSREEMEAELAKEAAAKKAASQPIKKFKRTPLKTKPAASSPVAAKPVTTPRKSYLDTDDEEAPKVVPRRRASRPRAPRKLKSIPQQEAPQV